MVSENCAGWANGGASSVCYALVRTNPCRNNADTVLTTITKGCAKSAVALSMMLRATALLPTKQFIKNTEIPWWGEK